MSIYCPESIGIIYSIVCRCACCELCESVVRALDVAAGPQINLYFCMRTRSRSEPPLNGCNAMRWSRMISPWRANWKLHGSSRFANNALEILVLFTFFLFAVRAVKWNKVALPPSAFSSHLSIERLRRKTRRRKQYEIVMEIIDTLLLLLFTSLHVISLVRELDDASRSFLAFDLNFERYTSRSQHRSVPIHFDAEVLLCSGSDAKMQRLNTSHSMRPANLLIQIMV